MSEAWRGGDGVSAKGVHARRFPPTVAYTSCSTAGLRAHQIVRPNVSQSQAENTRKKWKSACSGVRSCAWYLRPPPIAVTRHTPYKTADAAHRLKTYKTIVSSAYVHRAMGSRAITVGSPRPHLHRDWAHPAHICTGTGLTPATSAPGHCDKARPRLVCLPLPLSGTPEYSAEYPEYP